MTSRLRARRRATHRSGIRPAATVAAAALLLTLGGLPALAVDDAPVDGAPVTTTDAADPTDSTPTDSTPTDDTPPDDTDTSPVVPVDDTDTSPVDDTDTSPLPPVDDSPTSTDTDTDVVDDIDDDVDDDTDSDPAPGTDAPTQPETPAITIRFPDGSTSATLATDATSFDVVVDVTGCYDDGSIRMFAYGYPYTFRPTTDYGLWGREWLAIPYTDPDHDGRGSYTVSFDTVDVQGTPLEGEFWFRTAAFQGMSCFGSGGESNDLRITVQDDVAPSWQTASLPAMRAGEPVEALLVASDATAYTVTAGALPDGVVLDPATGALTGTPRAAGPYSVTITATSASGGSTPATFTGTVAAAEPTTAPVVSKPSVRTTSAVVAWAWTPGTTWQYRTGTGGTWSAWTATSEPGATLTGLTPGTAYTVEVRALDASGVRPVSAATSVRFTTAAAPVLPDTAAAIELGAAVGDPVAGAPATVTATGLLPGSSWTIVLRSTPQVLARGTAPGSGALLEQVVIPEGLEPGWHSLTLTGTAQDGSALSRVLWFEVTADGVLAATSDVEPVVAAPRPAAVPAAATPAVARELAATGADTAGVGGLTALGLIGLGAVAVAARRRLATR